MIKTVKGKIIFITILMLVVLSIVTSIFARQSYTVNKMLKKQECDLKVAYFSEKINKDIKILETNVLDLAVVGKIFYTPPVQNHDILALKVKENFETRELAIGGGIWYEPYTIAPLKKRFCSYSYHTERGAVIDESFEQEAYDYHNQDWYKQIKAELSSHNPIIWTKPYYDKSGTKALMTTVGAGIYYNDKLIGMSTLDWQLDTITKTVSTLCPTTNSFAIFADRNNDSILAVSNHTKEDFFGKPLSTFDWYSENIKNGQLTKINKVDYITFVRELDNNMLLIVNVPTKELFKDIVIWYNVTLVILLLVCLIVAASTYIVLLKNINEPIDYITKTGKEIGEGNLDLQMNIKEPLEFENLANVFNKMTKDIQEYVKNITIITADKERIQKELDIAKEIQESVLPNTFPPYPDHNEFEIYASMNAAKEIGGDFYDFFFINSTNFAYLVADVSGKGIPAALFMMSTKMMLKNWAKTGLSPEEIIKKVNHNICKKNTQGLFVTMFLAITDLITGKTVLINAGHNPPLLKKANGTFEYLNLKSNLVLGAIDNVDYQTNEIKLEPNDTLLLYTDGVTEAVNNNQEFYGEDRLQNTINNIYEPNNKLKDVITSLKHDVDTFASGVIQADDITMLMFKFNGNKEEDLSLNSDNTTDKSLLPVKTIYLPAQTTNWSTVLNWLKKICNEENISEEYVMKLNLIFEEIFVNISTYAYPPKTGDVKIDFSVTDNKEIEIKFTDSGTPYNPLEKPEPDITLPPEERPIGGLGIFLVKNMVDDIHYEYKDEKNILTLKIILS